MEENKKNLQEIEADKTHQEFCRKMQEANEQYVRMNFALPEMGEELRRKIRQNGRRIRYKRMGRFAAMLTMTLFTGICFGIWMNADSTYGGKQFSQKVVSLISPLDIHKEIDEAGNEWQTTTITSLDDLEDAAEFCGELYIPEYIPDGYHFRQLKIDKGTDFVQYEYTYENSEKLPIYIGFNFDSFDKSILVTGELYHSPRTGEEMYVNEIEETNEFTVTRITDEYECMVSGLGSKNIGVRIMENLRKL